MNLFRFSSATNNNTTSLTVALVLLRTYNSSAGRWCDRHNAERYMRRSACIINLSSDDDHWGFSSLLFTLIQPNKNSYRQTPSPTSPAGSRTDERYCTQSSSLVSSSWITIAGHCCLPNPTLQYINSRGFPARVKDLDCSAGKPKAASCVYNLQDGSEWPGKASSFYLLSGLRIVESALGIRQPCRTNVGYICISTAGFSTLIPGITLLLIVVLHWFYLKLDAFANALLVSFAN